MHANQRQEITDIREYRAKRRRAGSTRWVLLLVLLIACLFAGYFFARSDFFTIAEIEISGADHIDGARLVELSGFAVGNSLFSVTPRHAEEWLRVEPRVKSAVVKRRWPDTVYIEVTERQPVAMLNAGLVMIEIDVEGRILDRYRVVKDVALPLISGVDLSDTPNVAGSWVDGEDIAAALAILAALPPDAAGIGEINVANPQFIKLYTVGGTEIRLGDSADFAEKYLAYSTILEDAQRNSGKLIRYIDVSIYTKPVFY